MKNIICIVLLSIFSYAEYINNYNVSINIENNGSLTVIENIDYDFEENGRHGIYRDIPYEMKIDNMLMDIGLHDIHIMQDSKTVLWDKEILQRVPKMFHLKIGEQKKTIRGKHNYRIVYHIDHGVLPTKDKSRDIIKMNVIGSGWNVPIRHAKIEIVLPTSLKRSDVNISLTTGLFKTSLSVENIVWKDEKKVGITVEHLPPHRSVTLALAYAHGILGQTSFQTYKDMKERYAVQEIAKEKRLKLEEKKREEYNAEHLIFTGKYINKWDNIFILNWILTHFYLIIFGFLIYLISSYKIFDFSFSPYRALVVRYTPPKGLSLLQSGILLDKYADSEDIQAAIVELITQGYIEIEESNEDLELKRLLKSTNRLSEDQRYILENILFQESNVVSLKKNDGSLVKRVFQGIQPMQNILYKWAVSGRYIKEHTGKILNRFLGYTTIVFLSLYTLMYYILYLSSSLQKYDLLVASLIPLVIGTVLLIGGASIRSWVRYSPYFWLAAWMIMLFIAYNYSGNNIFTKVLVLLFIMSGTCIVLLFISYYKVGKYTSKGKKAQHHLLGLRQFIVRADKDRLERLLKDDAFYIEAILPYAMLYKETEVWMKNFELLLNTISKQQLSFMNQSPLQKLLKAQKKLFDTKNSSNRSFYSKNNTASVNTSSSSGSSGGGIGGGGGGSW